MVYRSMKESASLTSEVLRAARMLVRWDQKALAEASGVSHVSVRRLEAKAGPLVAERPTIAKLRVALESAGVEFIAENGGGAGVRLRKGLAASGKPASIPLEDLSAENDD
jgi:transcriptional regulator with XRE-family HTH domain